MSDAQLGQLLAALSMLFFSFGSVFISKAAMQRGDTGVLFSIFTTMVFSCVLWLVMERDNIEVVHDQQWWTGIGWFIAAGLFAMVFGRTLVYASIKHLGVIRSSSVKRLNPFFSALLAWLLLSEPITAWDGVGMFAIGLAFVLLIRNIGAHRHLNAADKQLSMLGYTVGVGAALAYAFANIARKFGLINLDAPVFGTMISAVSGFGFFVVAALFLRSYRTNLLNMFSNLNRWSVLAGICASSGQILTFAALSYESVSTVVMIGSLEVFVSSFLSVYIFHTERRPDPMTLLAAFLATGGVIIVSAG
jgi:drug/metabolite transporter (DMT)-like permease